MRLDTAKWRESLEWEEAKKVRLGERCTDCFMPFNLQLHHLVKPAHFFAAALRHLEGDEAEALKRTREWYVRGESTTTVCGGCHKKREGVL